MKKETGEYILIIDSSLESSAGVAEILRRYGFQLFFATTIDKALEILGNKSIDMILLDFVMADTEGENQCLRLKEDMRGRTVPALFMMEKADPHSVMSAYEVGGTDYILKHAHENELLTRVKTHLKYFQKIEQYKEQLAQMQDLAFTDALTGIANRLKFDTIFEHQLKVSKRYKKPLSLLYLDIDYFKTVNDKFGHETGDKVLQEIVAQITACIRRSDLLARWGGEEFAIISVETTLKQAEEIAEKLRGQIETHLFSAVGHLTCSIGITQMHLDDDCQSMMSRADKALYNAKAGGRNRVAVLA